MAQTAIPGLEVSDPDMDRMARRMRSPVATPDVMYGTPHGVALDPGAAEAARRYTPRPPAPTMRNAPPNAGPQRPLSESRPWAPTDGVASPPAPTPVGERIRSAGAATGQGVKTAGAAAGEALKNAGRNIAQDVMRGGVRSTGILSGVAETAGHGNAYFDDAIPTADKLRIGATDLVATAGSTLGAVGGGLFGAGAGSVVPGPGTVVGGVAGSVAGGYAGHKAGRAAGNFLFGGDEALQRHGYDPQRGIIDVAKDAISGKSGEQMFGQGDAARMRPIPAGNSTAGAGRGFVNPPMIVPDAATPNITTPRRDGVIYREGNSYSGTGNIGFGAEIDNARNPGVGVTSLPSGPGGFGPGSSPFTAASLSSGPGFAASSPEAFDTLGDMRRSGGGSMRSNQGTLGGPRAAVPGELPLMPQLTGANGAPAGFNSTFHADRARENRESSFKQALRDIQNSNMKPRDKRAAMALAQEQYMGTLRLENDQGIASMREGGDMARASMREGGDMARANLNAGVQRENNAAQISATMRGQDITQQGNLISAAGQRARLQYDMAKDQRDYTTGRADKAFEQGQQATKDLHQEIGSMIPPTTDQDGKTVPDTQNAARYATAMQALVGRMGKTMKDVDAKDKARFVAGMQLADVVTATATGSMTPWGTRAIQSNEPILALRKLPNGDYQTNRVGVNGETEIIPARYIEKEGSTLGFGGRASNKFASLME